MSEALKKEEENLDNLDNLEIDLEESNNNDDDIDLEIVDDTPEEDKGKQKASEEALDEKVDADDEIKNYSKRAQDRIRQLSWQRHEERRRREAAEREQAAAVDYAKKAFEETQRLKQQLSDGETRLVTTSKEAAESKLSAARSKYKEAYESGDVDKIAEASSEIAKAEVMLERAESYQPQYQQKLEEKPQTQTHPPQQPQQPNQTQQPQPDPLAQEWLADNPWFGKDHLMTRHAEALHEQLVIEEGVNPQTKGYWDKIDSGLRERFPEKFKEEENNDDDEVTGAKKKRPAVAAASRTSGGSSSKRKKKVILTQSEVNLCKKMGITKEQYAKEKIKLENKDL